MKMRNINLMILLEHKNIKTILQKTMFPIGLKKFLLLQKLKMLFCGHMLLVILMVKKLLKRFTKKNCKKEIEKCLQLKKSLKEKAINYKLNVKATIVLLITGLIKKV